MQPYVKPTPQQVRDWLQKEVKANRPPPVPEHIRAELWPWKQIAKA